MDDLTEKQYKTIRTARNCLMVLYVYDLICGAMAAFTLIFTIAQQNFDSKLLFNMAVTIAELAALYMLLFYKKSGRNKAISKSIFLLSIIFAVGLPAYIDSYVTFFSLITFIRPLYTDSFSAVSVTLIIIASVLFIFMAVQLLRKTHYGEIEAIQYKKVFFASVVSMFAYVITQMLSIIPLTNVYYIMFIIIVSVVICLVMVLMLTPQFVLYKAVNDNVFYEKFIVENPKQIIYQYKNAKE